MDNQQTQRIAPGRLPLWISIAALLAAGAALGLFFLGQAEKPAQQRDKELSAELDNLKGGLPPMWGGWPSNGFMVRVENGPTVYFTGDTGLMLNWEAIRDYYEPDIVIATHSNLYQMGAEEWAYAMNIVQPRYVLPSHYGSFPFYPQSADDFVEIIETRTPATGVAPPTPGEEFELMGLKFTWLGHAGYIMETPAGSRVVFDPEWRAANAKRYPEEFKDPEKVAADLILVSHGHFDHFDPQALRELLRPAPDRTPYLVQVFEFSAFSKKLLPEYAERLLPINVGNWITKETMQNAYGAEDSYPGDIDIAAVAATHSSGFSSPIGE